MTDDSTKTAAEQEAERKAKADREAARKAAADREAARQEEALRLAAMHAAQERAQLHAQAVAVPNVKAMVPFVLEQTSTTYSRWRTYFLNTLGKYDLAELVLSDDDFSDDQHMLNMDCTVKSWLFSTVSPDLIEIVSTPKPTSRSIWLGLEEQFIGNRETRVLILDAKFRNFVQGDLPVSEYCHQFKCMADALGDLGEEVKDRTLVLNVLRGLNDKFSYMGALIKRTRPLPSFREVRADLEIEEVTMDTKKTSPMALVASSSSAPAPTPARAPAAASNTNTGSGASGSAPSGGKNMKNNNKRRNRRFDQQYYGAPGGSAGPAWPMWNPMTGTFTIWPGPTAPRRPQAQQNGLMGARPPQPASQASQASAQQLALLAGQAGAAQAGAYQQQQYRPPSAPYFAPAPPPYPYVVPPPYYAQQQLMWDQQALAQAFNTMTLTPPPTDEWVMDSGASSHMTSSSGSYNEERDRQVQ